MSESPNFVDHVRICLRSGRGGAGSRHMRREKYIPKGGPDGGDGGRGGHVFIEADPQLWTLIHLRYKKHIIAGHGKPGSGSEATGSDGSDQWIKVPLGTIARDAETGEQLMELTSPGERTILLSGGKGGLGNANFKNSIRQTPMYAQPGEEGREKWVVLELKLLADVGLVGFPNAGKSTLLSTVSAAKPKIADYPFTTLVPNLGIVDHRGDQSFVMADIPGIIEGAHEGKGIGLRFLRHIERNSVLLFLVPADSDDIKKEYDVLLHELRSFSPELLDKERLLAISKSDLIDDELKAEIQKELPEVKTVFISSVQQAGLQEMKDELWKMINS